MRILLLLLVLANLLAFAWWRGDLDAWLPLGRDPARMSRQVAPEKLDVVPQERLEAARRLAQAACREVGPLDDARYERVGLWARGLGIRAEVQSQRPRYRIRFAQTLTDDERAALLAELASEAGQEPQSCAFVTEATAPAPAVPVVPPARPK